MEGYRPAPQASSRSVEGRREPTFPGIKKLSAPAPTVLALSSTISKDNTMGECARQQALLADFGRNVLRVGFGPVMKDMTGSKASESLVDLEACTCVQVTGQVLECKCIFAHYSSVLLDCPGSHPGGHTVLNDTIILDCPCRKHPGVAGEDLENDSYSEKAMEPLKVRWAELVEVRKTAAILKKPWTLPI